MCVHSCDHGIMWLECQKVAPASVYVCACVCVHMCVCKGMGVGGWCSLELKAPCGWRLCISRCGQAAVDEGEPGAQGAAQAGTAGRALPAHALGAAMGRPAALHPQEPSVFAVLPQWDRVHLQKLHQCHPGRDRVVHPAGHQHLLPGANPGAGENGLLGRAADPGLPVRG